MGGHWNPVIKASTPSSTRSLQRCSTPEPLLYTPELKTHAKLPNKLNPVSGRLHHNSRSVLKFRIRKEGFGLIRRGLSLPGKSQVHGFGGDFVQAAAKLAVLQAAADRCARRKKHPQRGCI